MEQLNNFDEYLSVLNEEQYKAVVHEGSPLLILAGAGSGKTRVITTKIAYLINQKHVDPYSILSVTFTKKAANEMKERAVTIEPEAQYSQIRTFHSFGSWFLRRYHEAAGLEDGFTVYDDDDMVTLVKDAIPSLDKKDAKLVAHQISLAKDYFLTPEDDLSMIGSEFDLNQLYSLYQQKLRATGNADFGDLIMLPAQIMQMNPDIADYIHNRFKVIMVDEYQDSNIAQYKLLQTLSGVKQGCQNYVCVVGDDDQSIYKFRGAEVQNILTFPDKFPGTEIIRLEKNYRSTGKILEAASVVVGKNRNRLGKTLVAQRGEGKNPVLAFLPSDDAEAKFCCDLINQSIAAGNKYSDFAILYRINAQSRIFEQQFKRQKIPYEVVGGMKFYEREEIKDVISYLSLYVNPKDPIAFRRIINKPTRGIGPKTQDEILASATELQTVDGNTAGVYKNLLETTKECSEHFSKKAKEGAQNFLKIFEWAGSVFDEEKNLSEFINRMIMDSGLDEYHRTNSDDQIQAASRLENMTELANSGVDFPCTREGLIEFLDSVSLDQTLDTETPEDTTDFVTLITLHNTKGLEFNNVIITGLEDKIFPRPEKSGDELEEERRLFYVGITRARNELFITSAAMRRMYGRLEMMNPSPFIREAKSAFKIIGATPPSMRSFSAGYSNGYDAQENELLEKYKKGTKLYHDDYGYGQVIDCHMSDGECICLVKFESGLSKKFLPQYQGKSLMIVKD